MKMVRKTTNQTERGKSRTASRKAQPARKSTAPKPLTEKIVGKKSQPTQLQINNILEQVSDGILAFDTDMNYTYVNTHGGELLGCNHVCVYGE